MLSRGEIRKMSIWAKMKAEVQEPWSGRMSFFGTK
ncbi:hypothetical protein J2X53_002098 [Pseudorhodobacter sp. 4114]|nr:hypothetical protein [Pseudorhodobacter sp. 4114]